MASANGRYPAVSRTITGEFAACHKDEIVHLARHREEQEEAEHPLHLIQDIEEQDASSSVDLHQSQQVRIGVLFSL